MQRTSSGTLAVWREAPLGTVSGRVVKKVDKVKKSSNRPDEVWTQEKCIKKCAKKAILQNSR